MIYNSVTPGIINEDDQKEYIPASEHEEDDEDLTPIQPIANKDLVQIQIMRNSCLDSLEGLQKEDFYSTLKNEKYLKEDKLLDLLVQKYNIEMNRMVPSMKLTPHKVLPPSHVSLILRHYRAFSHLHKLAILSKQFTTSLPFYFIRDMHIHQLQGPLSIDT